VSDTQTYATASAVKEALGSEQYIASDEIATTVYLSQVLGKPLLTEGPAGVGKTELAKAVAATTDRELIRLQCYEGLDETKALYEWEYAKQLLYTQLLRDKLQEMLSDSDSLTDAADRLSEEEDVFFSMRFLLQRPLLKAILSEKPTVLLIDEIDRADAEFEAFLLEILSDFQVSVPELGTLQAVQTQAVDLVQTLRAMDLRKSPSISETLDWAKSLVALNAQQIDAEVLENTMSTLLKHESDMMKARRRVEFTNDDGITTDEFDRSVYSLDD